MATTVSIAPSLPLAAEPEDLGGEIGAVWSKAWSKADWGGSWHDQSAYSKSRGKNRSTPLLPSADSPQAVTWYSGKAPLGPSSASCWRALGATWRDWDTDVKGPLDRQADDGKDYVNGCVPHWTKTNRVRTKGLLEHELTWAYYRMRRHEGHPQRQAVGESLPNNCVGEKMRFGTGCSFKFWHDLRPPFAVLQVKRVDDGLSDEVPASAVDHPDGELHTITYECAIEYFAERLLNDDSESGTFGNKVSGVAEVRIPNAWPRKRPIHILGWGNPTLNPPDVEPGPKQKAAPSQDAKERSSSQPSQRQGLLKDPSRAQGRVRQKRKVVKVDDLQRLQLGAHASLPRMESSRNLDEVKALDRKTGANDYPAAAAERRPRKHRVFTPACGFITYEG